MRTHNKTGFQGSVLPGLVAGLLALSSSSAIAEHSHPAKAVVSVPESAPAKAVAATEEGAEGEHKHGSCPGAALQAEVKQLREELTAVKEATAAHEETLKSVEEKASEAAGHSDLEALRDVEEEHILRSIGSSTSVSPYPVSGFQHLVNLTGSAGLIYNATPWSEPNTSTRSLRFQLVSLTLSGSLRQDPGAEGDVRYNFAVLGTQNKYAAVANTSQSGASSSAAILRTASRKCRTRSLPV